MNLLLFLNTASDVPRAVAEEFQPVVKGHLVGSGWRSWKEVEFESLERSSRYSRISLHRHVNSSCYTTDTSETVAL